MSDDDTNADVMLAAGETSALLNRPMQAMTFGEMKAAMDSLPKVDCGSEKSPHINVGEATPGKKVRCAVCGEEVICLPNGRAMPVGAKLLAGAPLPPLRFLDPAADGENDLMQAMRYAMHDVPALPRTRFYMPMSVGFDFASDVTRREMLRFQGWRRGKRPVQPRGKRRTDFGARIERYKANAERGIFPAKGPVEAGDLVALNPDGTVSRADTTIVMRGRHHRAKP